MSDTTNTVDRNSQNILTPHPSPSTLSIWQQNINKSHSCQHDLISSAQLARKGIDIVAIQEPVISSFGVTVASRDWTMVYPSTHGKEPHKTRSLFLLRSNLLTEHWKQIEFPSGDVTVIQLSGNWGVACIFNIYIDCESNDTITQLESFTCTTLSNNAAHWPSTNEGMRTLIWLEDFNCHHLHWDDPSDMRLFTRAALSNAEMLISLVAEAGLDLALPSGIPTHLHNVTKQ